jgi:hypothetical protein
MLASRGTVCFRFGVVTLLAIDLNTPVPLCPCPLTLLRILCYNLLGCWRDAWEDLLHD